MASSTAAFSSSSSDSRGTQKIAAAANKTAAESSHHHFLTQAYDRLRQAIAAREDNNSTLPTPNQLTAAISDLPRPSQPHFLSARGPEATLDHLHSAIIPALNGQSLSSRYYGFVTGGVLPVAEAADNIVTALDQNVQVHLPENHSVSTCVEDSALSMVSSLLDLNRNSGYVWSSRTFTTGATASNMVGLACAREAVISWRLPNNPDSKSPADLGLLAACRAAGVSDIQILTSMAHSSIYKAASIVGLGHDAVREVRAHSGDDEPWRLDLDAVERELATADESCVATIIVVNAGEVNTGRFATQAFDMPKLRSLADRYKAWIHVDGAFGIFARALPKTDDFLSLHANAAGLELADSIAADGHKLLNVPYDNGIFFSRHPDIVTQVFQNPNAAYLSSSASSSSIQSPLNVGIENSRRFRALPVYAALLSEGREGYARMLANMVLLARNIAQFVRDSEAFEWLPSENAPLESTFMIVLFRARDPRLNNILVERINETRQIFVSGTSWKGEKAVRLAVGSWRVDVERDAAVITEVLTSIASAASVSR
ncbi:L-2,4-diaminobutyrate decarboxylase [Diplogelasinospora grovesii]|uniref:L-2,4-diaminobutyrate decarboxylase n=1 Tax=Diplogelasinospora grovesii TaxID=303347 RepID=A0AAN6NIW9_9PEZI|nr:L-2,4-diaminobutyrate decarboxylase [Diplogelasinospora grovesii]